MGWKITADGDCSHEIKRCLLLGRKANKPTSVLKSKYTTLSTKVRIVKAMLMIHVWKGLHWRKTSKPKVTHWNIECNYSSCILLLMFSHSVMSDSLLPHGLQHTRLPCPSPTPGAYTNSGPLSQWCHPTISSSVIPFSHLQSFPASGSFPMSKLFASGGQNIGVSVSASVFPMNIQDREYREAMIKIIEKISCKH